MAGPLAFYAPDPIQSTQLIPGSNTPASGALLFCYQVGTTAKQNTYTDASASTARTNPIVLDSGGNIPGNGEVWIASSAKFVLAPFNDGDPPTSPYWTRDNLPGVNNISSTQVQSLSSGNEWIVGSIPTFVGVTAFTVTGDQTTTYALGRRIKAVVTGGDRYGIVTSTVFGVVTTIGVTLDSSTLNGGLSAVSYGILATPNGSVPWEQLTTTGVDFYKGSVSIANKTIFNAGNSPQFNVANAILVSSVTSSALTIALKTLAGADASIIDPILMIFRNSVSASSDATIISATSAISLTISVGSTLGTFNNTSFKFWITGFNDGGTPRLGAINTLTGLNIYPLGQFGIASAIAEGGAGAADSPQVFYANTTIVSKPYIALGYLSYEVGLATSGVYNALPTRAQLYSPMVPLPGYTIQSSLFTTGSASTGTTTIPDDDTIPQNSEGNQYMSLSFLPTCASNILWISAQGHFKHTAAGFQVMSLFQDATANALAATISGSVGSNDWEASRIEYPMIAGTTSSTTFNIRAGKEFAGTQTFNGTTGSRMFGGVLNSYIRIEEKMT